VEFDDVAVPDYCSRVTWLDSADPTHALTSAVVEVGLLPLAVQLNIGWLR
jgi:hypothetical protein